MADCLVSAVFSAEEFFFSDLDFSLSSEELSVSTFSIETLDSVSRKIKTPSMSSRDFSVFSKISQER